MHATMESSARTGRSQSPTFDSVLKQPMNMTTTNMASATMHFCTSTRSGIQMLRGSMPNEPHANNTSTAIASP